MKKFFVFLKSIIFFILGCDAQVPSVSVENLQTMLENDSTTVLIDVRNENEFSGKMEKIEMAINIPLNQLEEREAELDKYKDRPVYFVCRSGNRSGRAVKLFLSKGYNAYNVSGGMLAYSKNFRND